MTSFIPASAATSCVPGGLSRRALLAGVTGSAVAVGTVGAAEVASASTSYTWGNAQIYGGGFVPGIVYSPVEQGLVYVRTDIGGAYRRDPGSDEWVPLLDMVGPDRWGHTGVIAIAPDPVAEGVVYAAVGTYTISWDPDNGAVLRSTNRGRTWHRTDLPFKLGGNMPGRGMGERLAVDPHRTSVVYLGSPTQGLWRSTDSAATFARVDSFPVTGTYADVDEASDSSGYQSTPNGIVWVVFDPRTGRGAGPRGTRTSTIYVGVADKDQPVWRSTDGGGTWHALEGGPVGYLPHHGALDTTHGYFYVTTSDVAGPYGGAKGDVWRLDTADDTWTRVSPVPSTSGDNFFGYSGLALDAQNPGTLMVTAYSMWWPDTQFYRSTDAGATWTTAWRYGADGSRINRYTLDTQASPWLDFGTSPSAPETSPKLGWMTEAFQIDPFDSACFLYGTGATLFGADDLDTWDDGGLTVTVRAKGIEETAVNDLYSPPKGAPVLSALLDLGGFTHSDLGAVPDRMFDTPVFSATTQIDGAWLAPAGIARVGTPASGAVHFAWSDDGGETWTGAASEPTGVTAGGSVAVGADGGAVVWAPTGAAVSVSTDHGATWTASAGLPTGAVVAADRVDGSLFYGWSAGTLYRSTDAGATFTATPAAGLPGEGTVRLRTVPGKKGHVWVVGGLHDDDVDTDVHGLWRSTDRGTSVTRFAAVDDAWTVGFGKAAPGQGHPAVYAAATVKGVRGVFRSTDAGSTWRRINDDLHQFGAADSAITGDPKVYGRVYLGTNGRGVVYGDIG